MPTKAIKKSHFNLIFVKTYHFKLF